jgi:hypothetical protein
MSAYVVDDETINKIIDFFYVKLLGDSHYWPARGIKEAGYDLDDDFDRARLGTAMFALNVRAVNARYPGAAKQFRAMDYSYNPTVCPQPIQAYKSLQCWLYQCAEGDVPQTDLYKMFDEVQKQLAIEIVGNLPAYNAADWG